MECIENVPNYTVTGVLVPATIQNTPWCVSSYLISWSIIDVTNTRVLSSLLPVRRKTFHDPDVLRRFQRQFHRSQQKRKNLIRSLGTNKTANTIAISTELWNPTIYPLCGNAAHGCQCSGALRQQLSHSITFLILINVMRILVLRWNHLESPSRYGRQFCRSRRVQGKIIGVRIKMAKNV